MNDEQQIEIPIPDELLWEIIFKYIPLCRWSRCLELVSSQFHRCTIIAYNRLKNVNISDLMLRKWHKKILPQNSIFFKRKKSIVWLNEILKKLSTVSPHLIVISGFDCVVGSLFADDCEILANFHRLKSVYFRNLSFQTKFFDNLLIRCKNLNTLNVTDCQFLNFGARGTLDFSTLKLKRITVCNYKSTTNDRPGVLDLKAFGEKLTTLNLGHMKSLFKNKDVVEEVAKKCYNLDSLTVMLFDLDDYEILFSALPNLHKLTRLHLKVNGAPENFPYDLRQAMDSMKHRLKSFTLDSGTSNSFYETFQMFLFSKCTRLHTIRLHCCFLGDSMNHLPRLAANLRNLTLSIPFSREPISTPDPARLFLSNILLQLSNVTDLNLSGFHVVQYAKEWENLCRLEKLRILRMNGAHVTDKLLQIWDSKGNKMFEKLQLLEMPSCKRISDVGACLIAKKSKNLGVLDMSFSAITNLTIFTFANVAKKLSFANFKQKEPCLIECGAVISMIKNADRFKGLTVNKSLMLKLRENKEFLPFMDEYPLMLFPYLCENSRHHWGCVVKNRRHKKK